MYLLSNLLICFHQESNFEKNLFTWFYFYVVDIKLQLRLISIEKLILGNKKRNNLQVNCIEVCYSISII